MEGEIAQGDFFVDAESIANSHRQVALPTYRLIPIALSKSHPVRGDSFSGDTGSVRPVLPSWSTLFDEPAGKLAWNSRVRLVDFTFEEKRMRQSATVL